MRLLYDDPWWHFYGPVAFHDAKPAVSPELGFWEVKRRVKGSDFLYLWVI